MATQKKYVRTEYYFLPPRNKALVNKDDLCMCMHHLGGGFVNYNRGRMTFSIMSGGTKRVLEVLDTEELRQILRKYNGKSIHKYGGKMQQELREYNQSLHIEFKHPIEDEVTITCSIDCPRVTRYTAIILDTKDNRFIFDKYAESNFNRGITELKSKAEELSYICDNIQEVVKDYNKIMDTYREFMHKHGIIYTAQDIYGMYEKD